MKEILKRKNRHDRKRSAFSTINALKEGFDDEGNLSCWLETYNNYYFLEKSLFSSSQLPANKIDTLILLQFAYEKAFGRFKNRVFKTANKVK